MLMRQTIGKAIGAAALVLLVAVGAASASAAGGPDLGKYATSSTCPTFTTTQTFLPWSDTGYYFLGPAADFEGSLTGWTVKNAKIVSGNEPWYVTTPADSHSLSLPRGATVTSPSICVTTDTPDMRLFVNNTGSSSATFQVNMTYTNNQGKATTATVSKLSVAAKSGWTLTNPIYFLQNITSILANNGQTWVTFSFVSNGSLLIDDWYVDPLKHH